MQTFCGGFSRGGVALPAGQRGAQFCVVFRRVHRRREAQKVLGFAAFTAERQHFHAQRVQNFHAAARKALCRAQRARHRQLQHEAGPTVHRRACPHQLVEHGAFAALHKIPAHQADDRGILAKQRSDLPKLRQMPVMKRIVFTDHADRSQNLGSYR